MCSSIPTSTTGANGQVPCICCRVSEKDSVFLDIDVYGRTTPKSTATNGFHIGDPWVTIEDTTTWIAGIRC